MKTNFSNCKKFYVLNIAEGTLQAFESVKRYPEENPENIAISGDGIQSYVVKKNAFIGFTPVVAISTDLQLLQDSLQVEIWEQQAKAEERLQRVEQLKNAWKVVESFKK